jgi:hypothetical protein
MPSKVQTTISIDRTVRDHARLLGINLSGASEHFLRILIDKMATVDLLEDQSCELNNKTSDKEVT